MAFHRPRFLRAFLTADRLTLDVAGRLLIGPEGDFELNPGPFAILHALMQTPGVVLETGQLVEARWSASREPANATTLIRMAVCRAKSAIKQVGANPKQLRSVIRVGYRLDGEPRTVRAYTRKQFGVLERIIETHPDRQLVAELMGDADASTCTAPAFAGPDPGSTRFSAP